MKNFLTTEKPPATMSVNLKPTFRRDYVSQCISYSFNEKILANPRLFVKKGDFCMKNFTVFDIPPLECFGQKVLTTNQIAESFKCHCSTIRSAFNRHRKNFVKNVDYFYLQKGELAEFKTANYCNTPAANYCNAPFSLLASSLYLWTESGFEKLSNFIGTDEAKRICTAFKFGYFQKAGEVKPEAPQNIFFADDTFERLKFLIAYCADENLRDEMIKTAFKLIK